MQRVNIGFVFVVALIPALQCTVGAMGIQQLMVTHPDFGDVLFCGDICRITWETGGQSIDAKVELYRAGNPIMAISAGCAESSVMWQVPADMAAGPDYRIKITDVRDLKNSAYSQYFRIAGSSRLNQNTAPALPMNNRDWLIQTVDVGNVGYYTGIAVDAQNRPHISYYDSQNDDLKYAYLDTTWHVQTVDAGGNTGTWSSIAIDGTGHPHISYCNETNRDLMYAYWNGSSWQTANVDYSGNRGEYTSIALDSTGNPLVSYLFGGGGDLMYAFKSGTMWGTFCVDSDADCGRFTSLDLDNHDYPYISYHDYTWTRYWLKHAFHNGSSWSSEWVDTRYPAGHYSSIAVTRDAYPPLKHISYQGISHCDYAGWNGASWQLAAVDPNAGDLYINGSAIAVDTFGRPHIAYYRASSASSGRLNYAFRRSTDASWSVETVDSSADAGGHCSIVIDNNDYIHISYVDWSNGHLKYATRLMTGIEEEGGGQKPAKLSLSIMPNPSHGSGAVLDYCLLQDAHVDLSIYSITGQKIRNLVDDAQAAGIHTVNWDHMDENGTSVASGVYVVRLLAESECLARKIIVTR